MTDQYYSPSDKKVRCGNILKNYYVVLIVLSMGLIIIASWVFWISPALKNNLLESYTDAYLGQKTTVNKIGGNLSSKVPIYTIYHETIKPYNSTAKQVLTTYVTYDVFTNEKLWGYNHTNFIDTDGKYIGYDNVYFHFPMNTQKQNYSAYIYASGNPQPFVFNGESSFNGIHVYKFSCKLTGDVSDEYQQFQPRKILSDYTCIALIEPNTGDRLFYDQQWFVYTIVNGIKVPVSTGDSHTTQLVQDLLITSTREHMFYFTRYDIVIPLLSFLTLAISCVVVYVYTIQRQKIAEMKLEREKDVKLATIGLLASRLAHDIRNPLSVIKNAIYIMEHEAEDKDKVRFPIIDRAISRISHQIDDVMDFVRIHPLEIEEVDISTIIEKSIKLLKIPEGITINVESHPIKLQCDRKQLEIVFNNLITNAIESIKGNDIITIRVKETGDMVHVSIEDSGPGVPPELMEKIFEPLFTTKQTGTGLGLVSCKNIVEQHGGKIMVSNNPSTFTVILPKKLKLK